MFEIRTRSAKDPDMPQVRAINTHYILHTELPFAQFPPPPETYPARLAVLSARGLPYSVAMTEGRTHEHSQTGERVLRYANFYNQNIERSRIPPPPTHYNSSDRL
ncbi:hypothetical protein VI817_008830 [Penicillium citrinum]|nr:hypothetical protein VI817_008830 [Penicillium citrinum]